MLPTAFEPDQKTWIFAFSFVWGCILLQMGWAKFEGGPTSVYEWATGIVFSAGGLFYAFEGCVGFTRRVMPALRARRARTH